MKKKKIKKDLGVDENTKIILNIGELLPNKKSKDDSLKLLN